MRLFSNVIRSSCKCTMTVNSTKMLYLVASFITLLAFDLIHLVACDVYALPSALLQLKGQSYSLVTRMTTIPSERSPNFEVEEFYSSWQHRSSVNYKMSSYHKQTEMETNIPREGTIQADDQQVLLTRRASRSHPATCTRLTHEQASRIFTMGVLEGQGHEHDGPLHLIGPSRLLHFISNVIYELIVVDQESAKTDETFMLGSNKVKLVYKLPNTGQIAIYYGQDQSNNLAHGVPHEIHLFMGDYMTVYEFKQVNLLAQNQFLDGRTWSKSNEFPAHYHDDLALDLFSWPRAIGCTEVIRENNHNDKLDLVGLERHNYRFSFAARPQIKKIWEPIELVVGYEPTLSTLKVSRVSSTRATENIMNYMQMRRYHVSKRRNKKSDRVLDSINAMRARVREMTDEKQSAAAADEQVSCVMTQALQMTALDPFSRGYKLGDMLLGSNKFTYLGRAKVRGIDALMFESPNGDWPVWFQPPSLYYKAEKLMGPVSKQILARPTSGFIAESEFVVSTVIYLTATTVGAREDRARLVSNFEEPIALDDRLLLMEFYKIDSRTKKLLERIDVPIYDFSWHIAHGGLDGKRYVDFFALSDACPSEANENKQHARMDLMFKIELTDRDQNASSASKFDSSGTNDGSNDDWLLNDTKRNLAILRAIHTYAGLPTTMIYDVESRLEPAFERATSGRKDLKQFEAANSRLLVTFQVADHVRNLNELIYLGNGVIKRGYQSKFARFVTVNFYACYMLAAHFRFDTVFAFDPIKQDCFIYVGQLGGPTIALLIGSTFFMETTTKELIGKKLEVYEISRHPVNDRKISPIQRSALKFKSMASVKLSPILDDGSESSLSGELNYYHAKLSSFKMTDEGSTSGLVEVRDLSSFISNEGTRLALGLVASNAMNTLVTTTTTTNSNNNVETNGQQTTWAEAHFQQTLGEMTFGQCESQCLGSIECRAFSVCIRSGRIECVLTRADLKSKHLLEQLENIVSNRTAKMGEIFKLEVTTVGDGEMRDKESEEFVEVRKHPTCELHNKNYLSLVSAHHLAQIMVNLAQFKPVRDRDECAQRCFVKTIKTLRDEIALIDSKRTNHLKKLEADGQTLRVLYHDHQKAHSKMCPSFVYLDPNHNEESLVKRLNEIHHKGVDDADRGDWQGFCSVGYETGDEKGDNNQNVPNEVHADIECEIHQMDFTFMYDKHFGISLIESSLTTSEQIAYDAVIDSETVNRDSAESIWSESTSSEVFGALKGFVDRGENKIVRVPVAGASECAKICFLHERFLWPACKSFDIVEEQDDKRGKKTVVCQLNSVTLHETVTRKRLDLITNHRSVSANSSNSIVYWHYEPKPDLIGRYVDWTAQMQEEHDYWGPPKLPTGMKIIHLGLFWWLTATLVSLMLGTSLGLRMAKKFILKLDTIQEDTEDLVSDMAESQSGFDRSPSPTVRIEFRNLATCYEEPEKEAEEQEKSN